MPGLPPEERHDEVDTWLSLVYDYVREDSLNTIVCADYVYRVATAMKERKPLTT